MRKAILLSVFTGITIFLCWQKFHSKPGVMVADKFDINDELSKDKDDGILLAQEQEFEITHDIKLGYVPKYRLVNAYETLIKQRRKASLSPINPMGTAALTWQERGPDTDSTGPTNGNGRPGNGVTSGRMRTIWVDLADGTNKTVWVGGIDGGLWTTSDVTAATPTWILVNDFFGNLGISAICQDPSNTNIMYFGTGEKAVSVSSVRGGGVWKSADHGVTWNLLANTTNFWNVSKILCDGSGNVYVSTVGNSNGIQRSTDGGTSWTNITPAGLSSNVTEMVLSNTGRFHIVCGYREASAAIAALRFTDAPATVTSGTWSAPTTPIPNVQYNTQLTCTGNNLYALSSTAGFQTTPVFKSTDGGVNWAATATSPPAASGLNDLSSGQAWYNMAIVVDPADPNSVIAGGLNCYKTADGGTTWSQISVWVSGISGTVNNFIHADQHVGTWNGSQVLIGSDGGLFYSADGGTTFSDRNTGLRLKQFYSCAIHPSSTDYFLAGAQDNGSHQFTNPGLSGSTEVTGGDGAFVHIDQDEPQYQFTSYVFSQYRRSVDAGDTWSNINYSSSAGQFINPTDYDDGYNKMYTGGVAGQYIRWDDPQTGTTFTPVSVAAFNGSTVRHVMVSPHTTHRVFFGTGGGRIVQVDNANTNTPFASNLTGSGMSASSVSCIAVGTTDNNLLATFSNYGSIHVWVTSTGGGASGWTDITGNLPDIPVRWALFFPEDNTKALIATDMGVYETSSINGGSTVWTQDPSFPIVRTDMLQYRVSDGTVAAATHGRGLWTSVIPFTNPYVRFASRSKTAQEKTTGTTGCRGYTDYTINMTIDLPPTGDANVALSVAGGATALQGVDYDFTTNGNFAAPSSTLVFVNGSSLPKPITIRIYDDADLESTESFTLNYNVSGATNALAAPSSSAYTFSITDNEVGPVPGGPGTQTVGAGDFGSYIQPFRGNFQKAKSQYIYLASELTAAGFIAGNITALGFNVLSKTSTIPYSGLTVSLKNTTNTSFSTITFETGTTQCYSQSYSTIVGINTLTFSTPFNWDGTSNLLVEICYDNVSATGSGDNVSSNTTPDDKGIWNRTAAGTGCTLAAVFNNVAGSFIRPDILLTGNIQGNPVETSLNASKNNYLGPNSNTYFFNSNGDIIAQVQSLSAFDYGCTAITVDRAGTGTTSFWNNNPANYLMNKSFHIVPTTNNPSGSYNITLYFTAAEKAGWEAATGQNWNNIQLIKVDGQISQVTPATPGAAGNVTVVTPVRGTFGSDYTLSFTFSSGFSGFGAGIAGFALPVTLLQFEGRLVNNKIGLNWSTSSEQNSNYFEVQKSSDGSSFYPLGKVTAAGTSYTQRQYLFTDRQVNEFNYYRLKMVDLDGRFVFSKIVQIRNSAAVQNVWVANNPFQSVIDIRFSKIPKQSVQLELVNAAGSVVFRGKYEKANEIKLDLSGRPLSAGVYLLITIVDGKQFTNKVIKQ